MLVFIAPGQRSKSNSGRRAFTIIELLVVIGVISILMSLLLPAAQATREAARSVTCRNSLRQLALASATFETAFDRLPAPWFDAAPDTPAYSQDRGLFIQILPFIEESNLADAFPVTESVFDTAHGPALLSELRIFSCPSSFGHSRLTDIAERFSAGSSADLNSLTCDYIGNGGYRFPAGVPIPPNPNVADGPIGVFIRGLTNPIKVTDIRDGLSNTFIFWESIGSVLAFPGGGPNNELEVNANALVSFTMVADASVGYMFVSNGQPSSKSYVHSWAGIRIGNISEFGGAAINVGNNFGQPYSRHPVGCYFAFADASVRMIREDTDRDILFGLASAAGRETVPSPY